MVVREIAVLSFDPDADDEREAVLFLLNEFNVAVELLNERLGDLHHVGLVIVVSEKGVRALDPHLLRSVQHRLVEYPEKL